MTDFVFRLQHKANDFVTRDIGKRLREAFLEFEATVPADARITIDTSGVSLMTPSFVDEFFGRTAAAFGLDYFRTRFRIIGLDGDVKQLINKVVRNRLILDRREPVASPTE